MSTDARSLVHFARRLRKRRSAANEYLWGFLRKQALGVKFRRCAPLHGHVVDFYCISEKLVIDVIEAGDRNPYVTRDHRFAKLEINTLYVLEQDVLDDVFRVLDRIRGALPRCVSATHKVHDAGRGVVVAEGPDDSDVDAYIEAALSEARVSERGWRQ